MKIQLLPVVFFVVGCAAVTSYTASTNFTGSKSVMDSKQLPYILRTVKGVEKRRYTCTDITEIYIDTEIKAYKKTSDPKQPERPLELWRVTACNKTHYYPIVFGIGSTGKNEYFIRSGRDIQLGKSL